MDIFPQQKLGGAWVDVFLRFTFLGKTKEAFLGVPCIWRVVNLFEGDFKQSRVTSFFFLDVSAKKAEKFVKQTSATVTIMAGQPTPLSEIRV